MMTDPTAWPVRFVPSDVLAPFVRENEYQHHPAVLQRAAEALGYLPWTFWHAADCAGPCGVHVVCPWCWDFGMIQFQGHPHAGAMWTYNGEPTRPTVAPSILRNPSGRNGCRLHVRLAEGRLINAGTPPHGASF